MEEINAVISGIIMPVLLLAAGVIYALRLKLFYIIHPIRLFRDIRDAAGEGGIPPWKALSQALAGTLGVGNMAGVATAICAGGAGAVFWMWVSALVAMALKYAEVKLALEHRRSCENGRHYGGAMYYIYDRIADGRKRTAESDECNALSLSKNPGAETGRRQIRRGSNDPSAGFSRLSASCKQGRPGSRSPKRNKAAFAAGSAFAVLCLINSILTGTLLQMRSAAEAAPGFPPLLLGVCLAAIVAFCTLSGTRFVVNFCSVIIPVLSFFYLGVSMYIIISGADRLGGVMSDIFRGAFTVRSELGGVAGYGIVRAVRFGITRGIFSNEAGCGTSPTAHAQAQVKSPHHQGCFGIFEVFADTVVLCTMTALVILLTVGADPDCVSGIGLTVAAYTVGAGRWAGAAIAVSVILFALATVLCQAQYGVASLGFITGMKPAPGKKAFGIYCAAAFAATVIGTVIPDGPLWQLTDLIISLMTGLNCIVLISYFKSFRKQPRKRKT